MYCRMPATESHMNPFSEDACCLFRIGANRNRGLESTSKLFGKNSQSSNQLLVETSRVRAMLLVALLLWLLIGLLILIPFLPYLAYHKIVYS